ncbi:MAG: efflux RND transporter periplasmic adaptor subunit [Chthoniobacteraceae bacterium]|nr:efflux RND transporter periplasmic adaptor subunit [Chthoniobacteraceae bacterium]
MKKIFTIFLIPPVLLLLLWLATGHKPVATYWKQLAGPRVQEIPERYIVSAECRDVDYSIDVAGDVAPEFQLEVKSEVGGKIKALHVEPGQTVKAGDPLCEIDDTDLQNQKASVMTEIAGGQLGVDRALHHYNRGKELFKAKLITKEAFDNLESDYDIAKNELVKSQRKLQTVNDQIAKARIAAPANGTVLEVPVIEGQVVVPAASVNSGTTLMRVADLSKLLVTTNVNQVDVALLRLKQVVKLTMESIKQETMEARITFIAPVATIKNGVKGFQIQASILKPIAQLRPGMMVSLTVPVAHANQVVTVPISSVFRGFNDHRVVYVVEGSSYEPREVTLGVAGLDYTEVKKGLKVGDRILSVDPRVLEKKS